MDDQMRKHENWVQTQVVADGDQSREHIECNRMVGFEPMAWPTRPYVSS